MHKPQTIFKNWIPEKVILSLLAFALFPHMMLLSLFSMNSTFTASFLDVEVDDIQFLFSIAYATIVCGLFFHVRFFQFFNVRSFTLTMTMLNIVVLLLMSLTNNVQLLIILRFIQGPLALFEGCILLPVIISLIKGEHARLISFSFLYFLMLTGDKFGTSVVKFAIENYTQQMIFYIIMAYHIVALMIFLFVFNHNRLFPKKPLYQLNLSGIILMVISLVSGAYFLIYGKKLYWFESPRIITAFATCLIFSALFIWREITSKRPLFHFEIFKSKRVIAGIILFFFFYMIRASMSNIYQVMGQVWKWPWEFVLKIQYFNVAGSFIGILSAYYLMKYKVAYKYIFFLGFGLLAASMLYFSYLFYPDTRVELVGFGLILQGIAQGVLFCPLVFYMLGSVHPSINGSVSQSGTAIRFWTNTIGFSIMQNAILYLTTKHQFLMTKNLDLTHPLFQKEWSELYNKFDVSHVTNDSVQLAVGSIKEKLFHQALLVSNIEIFRSLFVLALVVALMVLIFPLLRSRLKF